MMVGKQKGWQIGSKAARPYGYIEGRIGLYKKLIYFLAVFQFKELYGI
jgi:hypothetical protein